MIKRFAALILCGVLIVSAAACTDAENKSNSSDATSSAKIANVKEYASKGQIYGCKYAIATAPSKIKEDYHYGDDNYWNNSTAYDIDADTLDITGENTIEMATGSARYYYRAWMEKSGIAFIAYFDDSFGFRANYTNLSTVKKAVNQKPIYDDYADVDNLFFFPVAPEDVHQLKYRFGDYYLSFFFQSDVLIATTIYSDPLWVNYAQ